MNHKRPADNIHTVALNEPLQFDSMAIRMAYTMWHHPIHKEADNAVLPFLKIEKKAFTRGWLRMAREALQLSTSELASRLKISRSAYAQLERNEETATLECLSKAADAMDCEIVFAIRPKSQLCFSEVIWREILPLALRKSKLHLDPTKARVQTIACQATEMLNSINFRRRKGWSTRTRLNRIR